MAKRKPTQDDILRLGTTVANIKAEADPKAWKALVKRAHAGGFTVAGELSGQPAALKERTQSSLKTQAQKTVASAYQPTEAALSSEQTKIAAYDKKRQSDNASYETWLSDQRTKQNAQLVGATTALTTHAAQIQADTRAAYAGTAPQGSPAAQAQVDAAAARGTGTVDNAGSSANAAASAGVQRAQEMGNVALAQASAREGQRYADVTKLNTDVIDKKSKLAIDKASDYLKEFTRLTDAETTKANSNRDASMLADKLDVSVATLDLNKAKAKVAEKKTNADIAATKTANEIKAAQVRLNTNKADYNGDGKIDANDRAAKQADAVALKAAPTAPKTTDGKPTAGAIRLSTEKIGSVSRVLALLQKLHDKYDPKYGGTPTPGHDITTFRNLLVGTIKGGASKDMIDLAEDARLHGGKLSAAGRKTARRMGILNPEQLQL